MAAGKPVSAASLAEDSIDTNELFEKHTIAEIREREKKIRAEIEKKKEDLRVMVGERYRDLIEAADTITAMKTSAGNVMKSISHMEELCQTLKQKQPGKGDSFQQPAKIHSSKKSKEAEFYGLAAQIKLLLDMPEKIWSSVESGDFLSGAQLFLLARHVNSSLQLDGQNSSRVLAWFPVLGRQWAAISHFKTTILQGCRSLLTDTEATFTDQQMAEILCSILLLEDSNPRQVFNEFLLARTKALQQTLHCSQQSNVKTQVCATVRLLSATLYQLHGVFCTPQQDNPDQSVGTESLLLQTLHDVTSSYTLSKVCGVEEVDGSLSAKCLPKSVKEFRPSLRTAATAISAESLQTNCQQWLTTCLQDVKSGVSKLLSYVNSVKRLADIRDTVWEILSQSGEAAQWEQVCRQVVSRPVQVWQEFLQPLFLTRVKALIQNQLDLTAETTKRSISKVMMELASEVTDSSLAPEVDVGRYLWSEGAGDVQMGCVWQPAAQRPVADSGGLVFKARAFTPAVHSLCQSMDHKLKSLLEDNSSYLQPDKDSAPSSSPHHAPFDPYASSPDIRHFCQLAAAKAISQVVDYMLEQLALWETSLKEIPDPATQACTQHKILLVARTCSALSELTPHLHKCILGTCQGQDTPRKSRSQARPTEGAEWQAITGRLDQCCVKAYRIWTQHTVSQITAAFTERVTDQQHQNIIQKATRWEEAEIMEETEEGKKLSSKIQVPMQASWYVHSTLFQLCQEFNQVGAHAFPRSVVKEVLVQVLQGMLGAYEALLTSRKKGGKSAVPLSQQEALQTLFNLKYILHMIPWRDDSEGSKACQRRGQKVVSGLEAHVDPFDLDVFSPYMQSNLMKASQRSAVLLGALSLVDRHAMLSGGRAVMSGQEQHNILALTSCSARFPLLPLGSQPSRSSLQSPAIPQAMTRSLDGSSASSLTSAVEATLPKNSSHSDLGAAFYDKLDRLGSMGSRLFSNIGGKS